MVDWLNEMSTDIEPADADTVIRSFDRRLRKLRSKYLLLRGKHWRTTRYHLRRLRENQSKLRVVEKYADELLKSQSSIRQDVGRLLKEILLEDPEWWMLLEWDEMEITWGKLSEEIKDKIRERGLAPKFDEGGVNNSAV